MWPCDPFRPLAKSLAMTLADASDIQAYSSKVWLSMSGAMRKIVPGWRGASGSVSGGFGVWVMIQRPEKEGWQLYAG
ncbi:hypothetical protein D3C87_1986360 [compost metagenome]